MPRRKGLKRSTPHKVAHRLAAASHPLIKAALGAALAASCQIRVSSHPDQGESECCAEHSAVGCCAIHKPGIGSPLCLASCTYGDVRAELTPPGDTLPPLSDTGAELQTVSDALRKWGLAPMGPQIAGRNGWSDVPDDVPGVPFPEPDVSQLEVAGHTLVSGEYAIAVDSNAPQTVAACISAGIPVWLGCFVDSAFEALTAGQVAQPPNASDPNGGGHAMYISGYRTAADGSLEFRVENSWGSNWCDGGGCWASTAWLLACWELWPFPAVTT
jgi:hypothetical protein